MSDEVSGIRNRHLYVPMQDKLEWKRLVKEPDEGWQPGRTAWSLANEWCDADGLPRVVDDILRATENIRKSKLLWAMPERELSFYGSSSRTRMDVLATVLSKYGTFLIAVKGCTKEDGFGPICKDWIYGSRRKGRFWAAEFAHSGTLIEYEDALPLRRELVFGLAAAASAAHDYGTRKFMFLVHAFGDVQAHFADFRKFAAALGISSPKVNKLYELKREHQEAYIGWVDTSGEVPMIPMLFGVRRG